mgnify:FL=1
MENILIRCSQIANIMSEPKSKIAKENGEISQTAKTYLNQLIFEHKYKRRKDFSNKYIQKGLRTEDDSIHLLNKLHKRLYTKNTERYEDGKITGEPDIITKDLIIDIKSTYDFTTHLKKEHIENQYFWQLCGYCRLTGRRKGAIAYVLNNTPFYIIENEFVSRFYKNGQIDLTDQEKAEIALCHTYSDEYLTEYGYSLGYWENLTNQFPTADIQFIPIPDEKRLRYYEIEFTDEDFIELDEKLKKANNYIIKNYDKI